MIFTRERLAPLVFITAALCLAASGCGDDDKADADSGETPAAARLTEAKQSPEAFASELAGLVADTVRKKDCKQLDLITIRSLYRFRCPSPERVRSDMAFLEVLDAASFGTGAVVDYKSELAPRGGTMVLFLSPSREWGLSLFGLVTDTSAESSDADNRSGYAEAVAGYLKAVREQDCKGYTQYASILADDVKAACKRELVGAKPLTRLLKRNQDSKPEYLGGSGTYGFYGLDLDKPKPAYLTLSIVETPKGSLRPYLVQTPTFAPVS